MWMAAEPGGPNNSFLRPGLRAGIAAGFWLADLLWAGLQICCERFFGLQIGLQVFCDFGCRFFAKLVAMFLRFCCNVSCKRWFLLINLIESPLTKPEWCLFCLAGPSAKNLQAGLQKICNQSCNAPGAPGPRLQNHETPHLQKNCNESAKIII